MTAIAHDPTPAERLRDVVRDAAASGRPLPGEPTLAAALGVSRPALREELARLERAGLIRRRQGASTIANPGAAELTIRFDEQVEYADALREAGFAASVELLERDVISLELADAVALHIEAGSPALRTVKRWRADGRAVMVAIDVIALPDGTPADADDAAGLFDLVRAISGDDVEWELTWPGAVVAPARVRRWLELTGRAPLLTLDLVGICSSGRRAYRATEYHVPGVVRTGFVRTVRG
jgi:DNA-binding GntR family transcriptional regulator